MNVYESELRNEQVQKVHSVFVDFGAILCWVDGSSGKASKCGNKSDMSAKILMLLYHVK